MKGKFLILCTGNSCRSQMAEGFLRHLDPELEIYSAGTKPAGKVNPYAVKVMKQTGIDISQQVPENVEKYLDSEFDHVITVCDSAKEVCPVFTGKVKNRLHIGFDDPADAVGSDEEILKEYRRIRDQIRIEFEKLYQSIYRSS